MKKTLSLIALLPLFTFAQQTITSVQNGNASSFLTWDCLCFPTPDDHVIINHTINMDVDWTVNSGGSILVNASGSLTQAGLKNILIDGAGSTYTNHGFSQFNGVAYTNNASGTNDGHFSITEAIYFGNTSNYTNSGLMSGIDSILTEGLFTNSGTIYSGNFLNTGTFSSSGVIYADSIGNTGDFASTGGYMTFNAFGNSGTFTMSNSGFMDVLQNWFNIGDFTLDAGLQIYAHNNFYNGDSIGGLANLHNNGVIEVSNDFFNGFNVDGTGNFCVANDSYNIGTMTGTFDFCDNSGGAIDWNSGTVAGTITYCSPGCFVAIGQIDEIVSSIYPNPSIGIITISSTNAKNYEVFDNSGKLVSKSVLTNAKIDLNHLENGCYLLKLSNSTATQVQTIVIQK